MKRLLIAAVALASLPAAQAQTALSSSTPVIGFYKFDVPSGTSTWSCALVTKKDFQGAASSIVGGATSTINVAGTPFSAGSFSSHYVEILSGPHAGMILDVATSPANTASAVSVVGNLGPAGLNLVGNETFCIRQHAMISTVLPSGGGLAPIDDNVEVYDSNGGSKILTWDGAKWVDGVDFVTPSDAIVYPLQGFKISSVSGATVTFGGGQVSYVKNGATKVPVYSGVVNLIGVMNPLVDVASVDPVFSAPLSGLGLNSLSPVDDLVTRISFDGVAKEDFFAWDGVAVVDGIDFVTPKGNERIKNSQAFRISPLVDGVYTQPQLVP
ncbi:MAG: hypothetical protein V4675_06480 [Verrucomicrobiota bacterium]